MPMTTCIMDKLENFIEAKLPENSYFYRFMNGCGVSDSDYNHAMEVWKEFEMKNIVDYDDFYLKIWWLDVFEEFNKTFLEYYGRWNPYHYFCSPGLAWNAVLKMTGLRSGFKSVIYMYQFNERGARAGVSWKGKRYAEAKSKYMKDYDMGSESNKIMCLDVNNFYGWAMSQPLVTGEFKWVDSEELDLKKSHQNGDWGLMMEVDL